MDKVLNTDFGLEMTGDDMELYGDLISAFLSAPVLEKDELLKLSKSENPAEKEKAAKAVHLLKGSSLQIGAERLGKAAMHMENVLREKERGDLDSLCASLYDEYEDAVGEIKSFLPKTRQ